VVLGITIFGDLQRKWDTEYYDLTQVKVREEFSSPSVRMAMMTFPGRSASDMAAKRAPVSSMVRPMASKSVVASSS
jgi:hypothetical protein